MSSIKNISASNPVPNDLAKRLGNDGIGVILATLWLGYKDLYATGMVRADTDEDTITVEWYTKYIIDGRRKIEHHKLMLI